MERIRFTITPLYNGWRVRDGLRDRDWFERLEEAVAAADTLAQARHALTGNATAVVVEQEGASPVLLQEHG